MSKNDDIINLPHHQSTKHPKMPVLDRAAQFLPFAALSGYDADVKEASRLTTEMPELSEDRKKELNNRLQILRKQTTPKSEVTITYFVPDTRKEGGSFCTLSGTIKKLDEQKHQIVMENGTIIPINSIYEIQSRIFDLNREI